MSLRWLAKLHCDGSCLVILVQKNHWNHGRRILSSSAGAYLSSTAFSRMMLTFNLETDNGNVRLSEEARRPIIIPEGSVVYARPGEDRWDEEEAGCRSGQVPGVSAWLL